MKKGCLITVGVLVAILGLFIVVAIGYTINAAKKEKKERIEAFNQARPEVLETIEEYLNSPDPSAAYQYAKGFKGVTDRDYLVLFQRAEARHLESQQKLETEAAMRLYESLVASAGQQGQMIAYDADSSIEVTQLNYEESELTLEVKVKNDGVGKEFLPALTLLDKEGREFKESPNSTYVGFAPRLSTKSATVKFSLSKPFAEPVLLVVRDDQAAVILNIKGK